MIRKTLLALVCLTALAARVASAQLVLTRTNKTVTGTVSGVDGTRVFLLDNRLTVNVDGATITSDFGRASVASLTPGTRISAGVDVWWDGSFKAVTVQILSDHDASLSAQIEGINFAGGTLRIGGQTVRFTGSTEEEQEETQRWLTRSLGEARQPRPPSASTPGPRATASGSVLDLLIGTSIQRRPIVRHRWQVRVTP